MRRIYTLLFVMLCTLTVSAEWHTYLVSDSIFEPKKVDVTEYTKPNGQKFKMYGYQRHMVDDDGMVLLTGEYQYMQFTDKPFMLMQYDDETDEYYYYYAFDWYYETVLDPETDTYVPAPDATYWYGQWDPWFSQLHTDMCNSKDDNWLWAQDRIMNGTKPWQYLWWTYENYTGIPFYYFSVDPGLYIVNIFADEHGIGPVLALYKVCDLDPIPVTYKPHLRIFKSSSSSDVNVNVWYTYYTITGGSTKTKDNLIDEYVMDGTQMFPAGEYAGCQYAKLPNKIWTNSMSGRFYYPAEGATDDNVYYLEDYVTELDHWYPLSKENTYPLYFTSGLYPDGGAWVIWDIDGKRVKFLNDADFQKALADATGVASTLAEPTSAPTYSLDGKVVTNPEPGQVYIQDGKKIFVK